jgi:thiamine pyrophosphokinase
MHVGIFTGGELHPGLAIAAVLSQFDKIIAADSGANAANLLQLKPDYIIGDFDSIDPKTVAVLKEKNSEFVRFPREKDATDTELAIDFAIKKGATAITLLGGTAGDRIDHVLANVLLASRYQIPLFFVDADSILWLARGPKEEIINGRIDDLLSLIPLSQKVEGIRTTGLQYSLKNELLEQGTSRGISNVFTKKKAIVQWEKGQLLIIHTLAKV